MPDQQVIRDAGLPTGFPQFDVPAIQVVDAIDKMNQRADEFIADAKDTIKALQDLPLTNQDQPKPATYALPDINNGSVVAPSKPLNTSGLFGILPNREQIPDAITGGFGDIAIGLNDSDIFITVDPFVQTTANPNIPDLPASAISFLLAAARDMPTAPPVVSPTIPVAREVDTPITPPLRTLIAPTFDGVTEPDAVTLEAINRPTYTARTEPDLPSLTDIPSRTFATGNVPGLPPLVEPSIPTYVTRDDPIKPVLTTIPQRQYSGPPDPTAPPLVAISRREFTGAVTPPTPDLITLDVPTFEGITEPDFTDVEPVFTGRPLGQFTFNEPTYNSVLLAGIQAALTRMSAGGTGIPTAIQQALFDAARSREDETARAAEQDAFDTYASRNFSMPPGMLVEAVSVAQERSRFNASTLERDILTKSAVWEIENLRFYVTQGIVLEGQLREAFNHVAQRTLEASKAQSEIEIKSVDVAVALYNAQQAARQIGASIYKTKWDGQIAKITAFRTVVEAVIAQGQHNTQLVDIYKEQWGGELLKTQVFKTLVDSDISYGQLNEQSVRVYVAQWEAVQKAVTVFRALIDSDISQGQLNEQRIKIWLGEWEAVKNSVEIFKAQVEGSVAQGQINEQRIRVYLGEWEGVKNAVTVFRTQIEADVAQGQLNESRVRLYSAQWESIKNSIEVFKAQISAEVAKGQRNEQLVQLFGKQWEGEGVKVQAFRGQVEAVNAEGQLNEQLLKLYLGQWEGVKNAADVHRTNMQGAQIQGQIGRDAIERFATTVRARADSMQAQKIPLDMWVEQMKGEGIKQQMVESQIRGFAETVRAQEGVANVKLKVIETKIQGARVLVEQYRAKLEGERDRVSAELAQITLRKEAFVADLQRYNIELQNVNEARRADIQVSEMRLRNALAYYETQLREYDASLLRQIKRVEVMIEALKATGQIESALGAGAMTAIHTGSTITGSGSISGQDISTFPHSERP